MRKIFLLAILTISYLSVQGQNTHKYSLNELIDSAIDKNFAINANYLNDSLTLSDINLLARNYQPKVTTTATFSYWDWLQPNKEKMLGSGNTDMYIEISAYQLLYDWGENKQRKLVMKFPF